MQDFKRIDIRTNEYLMDSGKSKKVDQICLFAFDMWFFTDITSERDIGLAQRMADELGIELIDRRNSEPEPRPKATQQALLF